MSDSKHSNVPMTQTDPEAAPRYVCCWASAYADATMERRTTMDLLICLA
jgi:hypothetical protein